MKNICVLLCSLFITIQISAQTMKTETLLNQLYPFWEFAEKLVVSESKFLNKELAFELEQSHRFVILTIGKNPNDIDLELRLEWQSDGRFKIYRHYHSNKARAAELKTEVEQFLKGIDWSKDAETTFPLLTDEIRNYLEIADRIVGQANDLRSGVNYTNLILTKNQLRLEQINRWNSRSLDHKDSYFLRDLRFWVNLDNQEPQKRLLEPIWIGKMLIEFSDASAPSRKNGGKRIQAQIELEQANYKN